MKNNLFMVTKNFNRLFRLQLQTTSFFDLIRIGFILKGGGNRPCETLATYRIFGQGANSCLNKRKDKLGIKLNISKK